MSANGRGVVILGAGHAGGTAVALLRQYGYAEPITLVGEEPIAPYQRPPLSKAWLKGEADAESLMLKPESFYAGAGIELVLGVRAVEISRSARSVVLSDGRKLDYAHLILATGARARELPIAGADLDGVLFLRSAADAERLKAALAPGARLAVIGGGYIGLEAAASARSLGAEAVVIEREAQILARVAREPLCSFIAGYHRERGVDIVTDAQVVGFEGEAGKVRAVRLADGRAIGCDVALIGIGLVRNDELARAAGLECLNGVIVDERARTADPFVYAVGDVTHRPIPHYNRMFWLESVANALEQAKQAASLIAGRTPPPHEVTWNWSDQYDLKLQFAGLPFDADAILVRGDPVQAKFAVFHLKGDLIQALEAVNAPAEFMGGRQLIGQRRPIVRARLADTAVSMKEVAA
ncbi:MAG TPA: FAD-dependent oxidoreductase [Caulobacteraceae bacterium]|nr:FAD-dependent oxidoreductase [Caulobacteraceae bacterium]